jgi:hypothetical protein
MHWWLASINQRIGCQNIKPSEREITCCFAQRLSHFGFAL